MMGAFNFRRRKKRTIFTERDPENDLSRAQRKKSPKYKPGIRGG